MGRSKHFDVYQKVIQALDDVRFNHPRYNDKWMTLENWTTLIKKHNTLDPTIKIDKGKLARAIREVFKNNDILTWIPNDVRFYKTLYSGRPLYCSMLGTGLPSTPPARIEVKEALEFDAETGFPSTRKRTRTEMKTSTTQTPKVSGKAQRSSQRLTPRGIRVCKRNQVITPETLLYETSSSSTQQSHSTTNNDLEVLNQIQGPSQFESGYWIDTRTKRIFGLFDPRQPEEHRYDKACASGTMSKYVFNRKELQAKLNERNLPPTGKKKELQARCDANNIPTFEMQPKVVTKGWVGKPKGMLQILWERGFIDPSISIEDIWDEHPAGGKKNNLREIIPGTALKDILSALPDFQEEQTLLQHHAESRSTDDCKIKLIRSPKCHPELAGEGIEYDWALAKSFYRRANLEAKKSAAKFRSLVKKSLSQIEMKSRRSFSARAREYMLAYDVLAKWEDLPEELKNGRDQLPEMSARLLDSIVKERKSHRNVNLNSLLKKDEDKQWVKHIMFAMKKRDVIVIDD